MPLLSVLVAVAVLLVLVLRLRLDAFLALLISAFVVGALNHMDALAVLQSILKGVGATMGSVALILVFGAMLGKLAGDSGAASVIAEWLVARSGRGGVQLSLALAGLLVGLPMLYNAGFLVLIPIVGGLAASTGLPMVYLGLPMASALSVTHGFLPPHPAPTFMAFTYGANVNRTLALGIVAAVPALLVGGIGLTRALAHFGVAQHFHSRLPFGVDAVSSADPARRPGVAVSILTMLVPIFLMLVAALSDALTGTTGIDPFRPDFDFQAALVHAVPDAGIRAVVIGLKFVGNANVALFVAVLIALYTLGLRTGRPMAVLMEDLRAGVGAIAPILLVIAAGGAFSQVMRDAGVGAFVARQATGLHMDPLLLAFGVAALMRLAVGSATVAGMTTAGLLAPLVVTSGANRELMVLATGAGSLMFSHFNDTGFWMFKEYFGLTIPETLATWSVMEMSVAIVGMGVVLVMHVLS